VVEPNAALNALFPALCPPAPEGDCVFERILIVFTFAAVLYLEFNEFFRVRGWVLSRPWPVGITPENSIYLVLLLATAILVFRVRYKPLAKRQIGKFRELVEQLYWDQNYGQLLALLQSNLQPLFRIANLDTPWSRLRERLMVMSSNLNYEEILFGFVALGFTKFPYLRVNFPATTLALLTCCFLLPGSRSLLRVNFF
jgi:hypothetical protein